VKGQKNEILTRPESRHSSRPNVFLFFAHRTFLKQLQTHIAHIAKAPTNQRLSQSFVKECNLATLKNLLLNIWQNENHFVIL